MGGDRQQAERKGRRLLPQVVLVGVLAGVVVLVVGYLTDPFGLRMSAVVKVRQQSRKVACSNNLKQLGLAAQMYLNDHRIFPLAEGGGGPDPTGLCAIQLLFDQEYIDDPEVVVCPASTEVPATLDASGRYTLTERTCSYLWNQNPVTPQSPSTTPLAACNCHAGGWNVLFAQGNVKWVTDKEFEKSYRKFFLPP
jgi:hypothetical protein